MSLQFDSLNPLRVKRAHSDEESENEDLVDDISNDMKRKKGRGVGATEYDEDSSDEDSSDEDGDKESDEKSLKNDEDSDDDMFASDDDEKDDQETQKKHKSRSIKTMDIDQFEKENALADSDVIDEGEADAYFAHENKQNSDDEDDDEDGEEEERPDDYYLNPETEHYIKPKKGPKMDAFNLKNENETGVFDESGNYYEAAESDDNEAWQDVNKKDIKKAKLAQKQRESLQKLKNSERQDVNVGDALGKLIALLEPVETPMEALARLNKSRVKVKRKGGKKVELSEEQKAIDQLSRVSITDMTEYCESLIVNGFKDIYELEREELMLKYKEETGKTYPREKKVSKSATLKAFDEHKQEEQPVETKDWEFRWVGDSQINGPYSRREILYWKDNYFNGRAEVRRVGENTFAHISEAAI